MKLPMKRHGRWICTAPPTEDIAKLCFDKLTEGDDIIRAANAHDTGIAAMQDALGVIQELPDSLRRGSTAYRVADELIAALALAKGDTP